MSLYADDLMLYRPIYSATDYTICYNYNRCVWSDNLLKFIDRKCKYMIRHLSPEESNPPSLYTSQDYSKHVWRAGTLLQESGLLPPWISLWKSVKYVKMARQQASILYRKLYPSANTSSLLQLYLAYIHPQVEYAAPVWDPHQQGLINSLERVQKFALKKCTKNWSSGYGSLLQSCNLPTLASGWRYLKLYLLYQVVNGHLNCTPCTMKPACPDLSETPPLKGQ